MPQYRTTGRNYTSESGLVVSFTANGSCFSSFHIMTANWQHNH